MVEAIKNSPMEVAGQDRPATLREVFGEDSGVFDWLAGNLHHQDPDMLTALLERFEATAAGYEMDTVLAAIQCPVLLLQADPATGGLMTDAEVAEALTHLAQGQHVRLAGVSHVLHNERPDVVVTALKQYFEDVEQV